MRSVHRALLPADKAVKGFGDRLKNARVQREMTQESLAASCGGKSGRSIYMLEAGERAPAMPFLVELAIALGCTTDYLCGLKKWEDVKYGTS